METPVFIIGLGLLIFGAHFFNRIFSYTKIPNALLFIVFGIIIGPVLKVVVPEDFGKMGAIFAAVTLILLLYESGTNLNVGASRRAFGPSLLLTLINFVTSATVASAVAYLFFEEMEVISALFFGVIVAGTSSAIVIPMLQQIKADEGTSTYLVLESALSDVLCLVVGLALFDSLAVGSIDIGSIGGTIARAFFIATFIGLLFGYIWSVALNLLRGFQNHILINLGMLFIIYGISEYFGLNGGIASLSFGFALGNSYLLPHGLYNEQWKPKPLLREEKILFSELVFVLATFFFVYVGINIVFSYPSIYIAALLIVIIILLLRPLGVKFSIWSKHSPRDLAVMSVMSPKGIVPAILAALPLQLGLSRDSEFLISQGHIIQNLTFSVILVSIVICSLLVIFISTKSDKIPFVDRFFASNIHRDEILEPEDDEMQEFEADKPENLERDPE